MQHAVRIFIYSHDFYKIQGIICKIRTVDELSACILIAVLYTRLKQGLKCMHSDRQLLVSVLLLQSLLILKISNFYYTCADQVLNRQSTQLAANIQLQLSWFYMLVLYAALQHSWFHSNITPFSHSVACTFLGSPFFTAEMY